MPVHPRHARAFTLLELVVVLAISTIIVTLMATSIRDLARTNASRQIVTEMQGEGRSGIARMQDEVREASLGSGYGTILANTAAGVQPRPAVQIFDNVRGGADFLDVKPGTDALLVVAATARRWDGNAMVPIQASVNQPVFDPVANALSVTDVAGFLPGQYVLVGPYKTAGWSPIRNVQGDPGNPGQIQLAAPANILPDGKLDRGAVVRVATARLYYVNLRDELVARELWVPHAPRGAAELVPLNDAIPVGRGAVLLARNIENLQLDCELDGGGLGWFLPCPGVIAAGDIQAESVPSGLVNPRLDAQAISTLRTVIINVVSRSQNPLIDAEGDDPIAIGNSAALAPSNATPGAQYSRRAYRSAVGVRNTSLGVL